MKKRHKIPPSVIAGILLLVGGMILLAHGDIDGLLSSNDYSYQMKNFAEKYGAPWMAVYPEISDERIKATRDAPGEFQVLFQERSLERIYESENGAICFQFSWTYQAISEGFCQLEYHPNLTSETLYEEMTGRAPWQLVYKEENACRWEGGAIGGKGYVVIEEIYPDWFYIEAYLPT
ncbi:MAG: hypothetical protein IJE17_01345 [Clostridia bacterium]|nr:hypothetical protein [Clostridia bacterium]